MTITFEFFADAGLTIPLDPIAASQAPAVAPADVRVFYGSNTAGRKLQNATNPGVDAVLLSLYDAASGSGLPVTAITLALSAGELDTNTPGDPVALGVTLLSEAANAVEVFLRVEGGAAALGNHTDLRLRVTAMETDQ